MATTLFSWVHLSDIHQDHGDTETRWDQRLVLEALVRDLDSLKDRGLPAPNAVFVTGDIAFSGNTRILRNETASREYERVGEWLSGILQTLKLERESLFLVPGNHDVPRIPEGERDLRRLVRDIRDGQEQIDDALEHEKDRAMLLERMKAYKAFWTRMSSPDPHGLRTRDLSWSQKLKTQALTLRIIGLNTALLAADNKDKGHLYVGKQQLQELQVSPKTVQPEVTIVLSHHPFDWLADEAEVSAWVKARAHVHLCGHVHGMDSEHRRGGSGQDLIRIVAGAAHADDGHVTSHGYNVAALMVKDDRHLALRVWPRKWSDKNKRFQDDPDNTLPDKSYAEHDISVRLPEPEPERARFIEVRAADTEVQNQEGASRTKIVVTVHDRGSLPNERPIRRSDLPVSVCDSPPTASAWVGRETELSLMGDSTLRVVVISGIGGQGKSMLASRFISTASYELWDWRDCRETGNTLQTHIVQIIERLSSFGITSQEMAGEKFEVLADVFFKLLSSGERRRCVFVFDNIDHYIDAETDRATSSMKHLMERAMSENHRSLFIFTCRPVVSYDEPVFYNLLLSGLSASDTQQLFELRGVVANDGQVKRHIADAQVITQGHPLWLNLIATQVSKNRVQLPDLLSDIRRGKDSSLPSRMLNAVWKTLNTQQQDVLRCMAETVRPETEQSLGDYLDKHMTFNRFAKALRALVSLNLVVVKSAPGISRTTYELHPLVREYIRRKFRIEERMRFIDSIVYTIERIIEKFRPQMREASFPVMENWTVRAELAINAGRFKDALKAIEEVKTRMLAAGHGEEFVRITGKLLDEMNWNTVEFDALSEGRGDFDSLLIDYVMAASELDKCSDIDRSLERYEKAIPGKNARFIHLCVMRCHAYWARGDFAAASLWGRKGQEIREYLGADTRFNPEQPLALALRDKGDVEEALKIFLGGTTVSELVDNAEMDWSRPGHFYGNIGRCLWLLGKFHEAVVCYRKSALLLERTKHNDSPSNRGWARLWIGEALERVGDFEAAYYFYRDAERVWCKTSPRRAQLAATAAVRILDNVVDRDRRAEIGGMTDLMIENTCLVWVNQK